MNQPGLVRRLRYSTSLAVSVFLSTLVLFGLLHSGQAITPFYAYSRNSYAVPRKDIKATIIGRPSRVVVPRLSIDLAILPGIYNADNNSWTISDNDAQYALLTPQLNDTAGNTLIYGHNSWQVFGSLINLQSNDELLVYSQEGKVFHYQFVSARDVDPADMSVFEYTAEPTVTLQTCSGNWNEKRRMSQFRLTGITS